MGVLLVAQLMAAGLVGARLLSLDADSAVAVAAAAMLLCFVLRGTTGNACVRGILFPVMLAAFLAPAMQISFERYGIPVPQIAYANALWQIQGLEETLLEQDLADPAVLKPILTPFLSLTPLNFFGLVLGLALGVASLPNVLSRHFMAPTVRSRALVGGVGALFAALILSARAGASRVRQALRARDDRRPHRDRAAAGLGLYLWQARPRRDLRPGGDRCSSGGECLRRAARRRRSGSALRLQDLVLESRHDRARRAGDRRAGRDDARAARSRRTRRRARDGRRAARRHRRSVRVERRLRAASGLAARLVPYAIAAAASRLAALAATTRPAGFLTVATWALVLAASGLFPALVAALWWPRASAWGVTAAMLTGLAVALFYLVGTRYFAVAFFETFEGLSSAGPTARETFAELKQAWSAAGAGPASEAAWAALDAHARTIANWWGIKGLAAALLRASRRLRHACRGVARDAGGTPGRKRR